MSHQHFCDFGGHTWTCEGTAGRLFQAEATVCMCLQHAVPMEIGDHSECSIELLACPEHHQEQLRAMGRAPETVIPTVPEDTERFSLLKDAGGNPVFARCLWCAQALMSPSEHELHVANEMAACTVYQALKNKTNVPPLLAELLGELGGLDDDEKL